MKLEDEIKQKKPFENPYQKATVNLVYTGKWIIALHTEFFHQFGLTFQQYNVLRILKGAHPDPVSLKYIKTRLLDKMSDASRIVELMYRKKLLSRNDNSRDRRKVDINLTKIGLDKISKIQAHHSVLSEPIKTLSIEEVNQLNFLLDKVRG